MDWRGKRVVIVGAARQGTALAAYLAGKGANVVLTDQRSRKELLDAQMALKDLAIEWVFGGHPPSLLDGADLICPSGGVPLDIELLNQARRRNIPLSNDSQIFMQAAPCRAVGITGSAGKTTTTTLVGRMAKATANAHSQGGIRIYRKAWVGGNIGAPLIAAVDEMQAEDLAVLELSSFQLELMDISPHVAAVLNVTPNHLDRHKTMEAYSSAKRRILDFQSVDDIAVLSREDRGAWGMAHSVKGELYSFGKAELTKAQAGTFLRGETIWMRSEGDEQEIMSTKMIALRGEHNLMNVLAACCIGAAAGLPIEAMQAGVEGFKGVPHRLEFVRRWGGADWYNDSIATAPERAIAAISSFDEPLVLLAGGRDKDLPWDDFARLVRQRVDHVLLFGEAAELIDGALGPNGKSERPYTREMHASLEEAVAAASKIVQEGDVVLLAPGGTSYDAFKDFEERGELYKELVMAL
jgi:UDP-N-acetylmuramoylalanine--D-glutamate ligase